MAFKILVRLADGNRYVASKTFTVSTRYGVLAQYDRVIAAAKDATLAGKEKK